VPDFRILAGKTGPERPDHTSVVETLIHRAEDIANRYRLVAANLPYRAFAQQLQQEDISALTAQLAAATWKRLGDDVPSYAFAERLGRRYRQQGVPESALLLHWQILRRAIHLVLADRKMRTGQGTEDLLRQGTILNYTLDWAIEASLVAFVIAHRPETGPTERPD
jgi:hypothetical protein